MVCAPALLIFPVYPGAGLIEKAYLNSDLLAMGNPCPDGCRVNREESL